MQLRSFGMYSYRISDPAKFFKEVSGVAAQYSGVDLENQLRNIAVTQLAAAFGSSGIPFLDMAANQVLLSQKSANCLVRNLPSWVWRWKTSLLESITLPASIQAALDKKISMGVIGDLGRYTQYQTAESIPLAAQMRRTAGIGAGLGVGAGIGQAMAGAMAGMMQPNAQHAQQNVQPAAEDPQAKLVKLKSLLDGGLISQEDFDKAKLKC